MLSLTTTDYDYAYNNMSIILLHIVYSFTRVLWLVSIKGCEQSQTIDASIFAGNIMV